MAKFGRLLILCVGLGILGLALGTITNHPVSAAPTESVAVTNFPSTQNVSGTVGINNFLASRNVSGTVNVGNFPASQNVNLANTQTQPVPTVYATIQPSATSLSVSLVVGSTSGYAAFTVPSGQRLIIEYINGLVCLPVGQKAVFQVDAYTGANLEGYFVPGTARGTFNQFGGTRHAMFLPLASRCGSMLTRAATSSWRLIAATPAVARVLS